MVGVAVKVTDEPTQIAVADAAMLTAGARFGLTVMATVLLVTDAGVAQVALLVSTQVTASVLLRVALV